jgi:hypothetical protein
LQAFAWVLFVVLRLDRGSIQNIDEVIPLTVSRAMAAAGHLDTNWALADGLPKFAHIPTYLFSSYILVCHAALSVTSFVEPLIVLKTLNILLQSFGVLAFLAGIQRLDAPYTVRFLTLLLLAAAPGLIHDAHMARPESLLFMFTGIVFWLAAMGPPTPARALGFGLVIGLGVATKITFVFVSLIAAPLFVAALWRAPLFGAALVAMAAAGTVGGYVAGAPYSLFNLDATLNGFQVLRDQYAGGHPPHSHLSPSLIRQIWWIISFHLVVYGPGLLTASVLVAIRRPPAPIAGLLLYAAFFTSWFAFEAVFFERNFILVFVALIVILACYTMHLSPLSMLLAALSLPPMLWWSSQIAIVSNWGDGRRTWEVTKKWTL